MSYLNKGLYASKIGALLAFERLKIWFDPATTGSPYESEAPKSRPKIQKRYPFMPRKLSMGM